MLKIPKLFSPDQFDDLKNYFCPQSTFQNLSEAKQKRITSTAMEAFGEKGYQGTSINSLVDRIGIAKGSIFQYFGDKRGLFLYIFIHSMEKVKLHLKTVRDETADADIATRLEKTLLAGEFFLKDHPRIYKLYLKILYESNIPFKNELLLFIRKYSVEYIHSLILDAQQKGEIRADIDIHKAVFMMDAVMDRFLQAQAIRHMDADLGIFRASKEAADNWIKSIVNMMLCGIGCNKESQVSE
jgi:AcrR family transcriptional regulator